YRRSRARDTCRAIRFRSTAERKSFDDDPSSDRDCIPFVRDLGACRAYYRSEWPPRAAISDERTGGRLRRLEKRERQLPQRLSPAASQGGADLLGSDDHV